MRVISGRAKGHRLKSIRGLPSLRPTSDLVREALFSMLENIVSRWSQVLDLYAGSGALGIEALSRGADWVDFVEQNRRACDLIVDNLESTGFSDQAKVYCCDVKKAFSMLDEKYDLVLLDPPYSDTKISDILIELTSSPLVGEGSTIVVEYWRRVELKQCYGRFCSVKERRHGDTCISIYR